MTPAKVDVQQAVDALCSWLDANTWIDLHDDEAYVVEAIEHGARLLKWLPMHLKIALAESWGLTVVEPPSVDDSEGEPAHSEQHPADQ